MSEVDLAARLVELSHSTDSLEPGPLRQACEARLLMAQGKFDEALQPLQVAMDAARSLCASSAEGKFLWIGFLCDVGADLAATLDYLGDVPGAEGMYNELLGLRPNGVFLGDYAIFLHRRKRDFVQAEVFYVRALQLFPQQSSIHLKYAGFLRHVKKDLKAADAAYRKAIEADKTHADAIGAYASFLHGVMGKADLAEELYVEAVRLDGTHANNLCNYGLFLSEEKGQYAAAEKLYLRALAHTPKHANTLYNYAVMLDTHVGGSRKAEAEGLYRRALLVEPRHAFCLYNLAVLLEDKVLAAERLEDRTAVKEQGGLTPEMEAARWAARGEVGSLYERAVECDPRDATAVADYGRYLLTRMSDADAAEKQLFAALQLDAESVVAQYNMALLLHKHRSNLSGAEGLLTRLTNKSVKHAAALQQLARVLLDKFRASGDDRDLEACFTTFHKAADAMRADPSMCLLEYLKVVLDVGSGRQRRRAVGFVEEVLGAADASGRKVGRQADVRAMIEAVKVLGNQKTKAQTLTLAQAQAQAHAQAQAQTQELESDAPI